MIDGNVHLVNHNVLADVGPLSLTMYTTTGIQAEIDTVTGQDPELLHQVLTLDDDETSEQQQAQGK